jgi:WD40 repeat protein
VQVESDVAGSGDLPASQDGFLRLWDVATAKMATQLAHPAALNDLAFSPTGEEIATACADGKVRVWDMRTKKVVRVLAGHQNANGVDWSRDGSTIASAGTEGTARLWDAKTGKSRLVLQSASGKGASDVALSADSRWAALAVGDALEVWDARTGDGVETFRGSVSYENVAFAPDRPEIAAGLFSTEIFSCRLCTSLDGLLALARGRLHRSLSLEERRRFSL